MSECCRKAVAGEQKRILEALIRGGYLQGKEFIPHIKPTYGSSCTCRTCGYSHDGSDCVCVHNELLSLVLGEKAGGRT